MGFALEIFLSETKTNLDLIRAIRNAFAHAHVPITFNTPQIERACKLLKRPALLPPFAIKADGSPRNDPQTTSDVFRVVCEEVAHNLLIYGLRCFQTHPARHGSGDPFDPGDDRYEIRVRPKRLP
jgi:hypothetical protein